MHAGWWREVLRGGRGEQIKLGVCVKGERRSGGGGGRKQRGEGGEGV